MNQIKLDILGDNDVERAWSLYILGYNVEKIAKKLKIPKEKASEYIRFSFGVERIHKGIRFKDPVFLRIVETLKDAGYTNYEIGEKLNFCSTYFEDAGLPKHKQKSYSLVDKERAIKMAIQKIIGKSLNNIGKEYDLTRERVRQILNTLFPETYDILLKESKAQRLGGLEKNICDMLSSGKSLKEIAEETGIEDEFICLIPAIKDYLNSIHPITEKDFEAKNIEKIEERRRAILKIYEKGIDIGTISQATGHSNKYIEECLKQESQIEAAS